MTWVTLVLGTKTALDAGAALGLAGKNPAMALMFAGLVIADIATVWMSR